MARLRRRQYIIRRGLDPEEHPCIVVYQRQRFTVGCVTEKEFAYFSIEQGAEYAKGWLLASNIKKSQIICEV